MTQTAFHIVLRTGDDCTGECNGAINSGGATTGAFAWTQPAQMPTVRAEISVMNGSMVALTGNAWRALEEAGCVATFVQLLALDAGAAGKVVDAAENGSTVFRTIVTTSDCTLSQTVYTSTDDTDVIFDTAKSDGLWEYNEGNPIDDVYLGGGKDDIEQIGIADYLADLLRTARARAQASRHAAALRLLERIAAMKKWGEPDESGKPFEPSDGLDDSHDALMGLIDDARALCR
jgi:hypothetical protein